MTTIQETVEAPAPKSRPAKKTWRRFVPFGRESKRNLQRRMVRAAAWRRLSVPFGEEWAPYKRRLRTLINRLAVLDGWEDEIASTLKRMLLILTFAAFFVGPLVFFTRHPPWTVKLILGGLIAHVGSTIVLTAIMLAPFAFAREARMFGSPAFFVFVSALIGTTYAIFAIILFQRKGVLTEDDFFGATALTSSVFSGLVIVVTSGMHNLTARYFSWRRMAAYPEASIAGSLIDVISFSYSISYSIVNVRTVFEDLERAAVAIGVHLPRTFVTRDPDTELWAKREFASMAAAIRELKKLVVIPKTDSAYHLRMTLRTTIFALLDRNWRAIPRVEPAAETRQRVAARIGRALRTIIVAVAPISALAIVTANVQTPIKPGLLEGFIVVAAVWGVVGVMLAIDPEFTKSVSQTLSSLVPQKGKAE